MISEVKMKIVKSPQYKYWCDSCGNGFDWGSDCWQYGKIDEPEKAKVFCSTKCKKQYEYNTRTTS